MLPIWVKVPANWQLWLTFTFILIFHLLPWDRKGVLRAERERERERERRDSNYS